MNRHVAPEDLSAHLDRALPRWRAAQVQAHLEHCAQCRAALADLEWAVGFARAMPLQNPPPEASARLALAIRPEAAARPRPGPVPRLALAATVVLAFAGVLWLVGRASVPRLAYDAARDLGTNGPQASALQGPARAGSEPVIGDGARASAERPDLEAVDALTGGDLVVFASPDSRSAGHPRPFATARQDDYDRVGGVPPPELAAEAAPSARAAPYRGTGEASTGPNASATEATDAAGGTVAGAAPAFPVGAPTAEPAAADEADEAVVEAALAPLNGGADGSGVSGASPAPATTASPDGATRGDGETRWMVAVAAGLLLLSAVLFVRASNG